MLAPRALALLALAGYSSSSHLWTLAGFYCHAFLMGFCGVKSQFDRYFLMVRRGSTTENIVITRSLTAAAVQSTNGILNWSGVLSVMSFTICAHCQPFSFACSPGLRPRRPNFRASGPPSLYKPHHLPTFCRVTPKATAASSLVNPCSRHILTAVSRIRYCSLLVSFLPSCFLIRGTGAV